MGEKAKARMKENEREAAEEDMYCQEREEEEEQGEAHHAAKQIVE